MDEINLFVAKKGFMDSVVFQKTGDVEIVSQDLQFFSSCIDKDSLQNFFIETKKIKSYLNDVQRQCNVFDATIPSQSEVVAHIDNIKMSVFKVLNDHFDFIGEFSSQLAIDDYVKIQKYYQSELLPFFGQSVLNKMIYEKPLGYAGDFIMMKHYYNDDYYGNSTFEVLCHRFTLELPASRANINRRGIFLEEIKCALSKNPSARICSFGSGPAIEYITLLKQAVDLSNSEFSFVDIEKRAFDFLKANIHEYGKNIGTTHFLRLDILKLITGKIRPLQLQNLDLIYASGIFDYFNDKIATRMLNLMYEMLQPNGKMVIVNVAKGHNLAGYMEFLGDWKLHLRDEFDLNRLASDLKGYKRLVTTSDQENGANIYLVIEK